MIALSSWALKIVAIPVVWCPSTVFGPQKYLPFFFLYFWCCQLREVNISFLLEVSNLLQTKAALRNAASHPGTSARTTKDRRGGCFLRVQQCTWGMMM